MNGYVEAFRGVMAAAGLNYMGEIVADGTIHRIKINGDHAPNGWYVIRCDGLPTGWFGDFKRDIKEKWCFKSHEALTPEERAERDRKWKQQQAEHDAERRRIHDAASFQAQVILDTTRPAPDDHPYLMRKKVRAYPGVMVGVWTQRQTDDCLLIPLRTAAGRLATVQAISPTEFQNGNNKEFLKGGEKKGAYFALGDPATADAIFIAEGYATAASVLEAAEGENWCAIMACDSENLKPVAKALRALYPDTRIVIAADDDRNTDKNPGLTKGTAAAEAINALLAVPQFAEGENGSDFNDLMVSRGIGAVREALLNAEEPNAESQQIEPQQAELGDDPYRGTDEANAALFLSLHGADVRYCPPWEKWLLWTGSHWRIDDLMDVTRLAGDLPRELYQKAGKETDSDRRRTIAKLARVLESRRRQNDLLAAARCRVVVSHTGLDKNRFLLNAKNGTIDLSTGERREHRRGDLLTHDTEIPYKPDANASIWERFLSEIFAGDTDLIRFVQRAVGYSLTGDVREQVLLICHGNGSNGKSVFLNIVRKLLGKLALQAAPDLLMADRHRRHPTEQADLFGKRLVSVQETAEGRRFNEALVKQLTGGDAVRARRMCEDFWEFEPTWKIWLSTNHRPEIRGTDHAIWRRVRLIPFNVQFSDNGPHRKDPGMEAKLTAELPGILAWAVRGCLDWQREGLHPPTAVTAATDGYRADMDVLAAFINDCCVIKHGATVRASNLYRAYAEWCDKSGENAENQRRFGQRLTERNFEKYTNDGVWYRGIGLIERRFTEGTEGTEPEKAKKQAHQNLAGESAIFGSVGSVGSVGSKLSVDANPDREVF